MQALVEDSRLPGEIAGGYGVTAGDPVGTMNSPQADELLTWNTSRAMQSVIRSFW
jgi:hypothetical protein